MKAELLDSIDKEGAAIASIDSLPSKGDMILVAAAKTGNRKAFGILVDRHERRVFFVAWRITRKREDAEDVVQQSFLKAFIHLKKFEGESSFSTWLIRIAINEALMLLRRKRGSREVPIAESTTDDEIALPLDIPDLRPNPEDSCLQREQERIVSAAVSKLTQGMRKAIELRELSELSTGETARAMGLSVGAVKARVFHGRRKLRTTLKPYVASPPGRMEPERCERREPFVVVHGRFSSFGQPVKGTHDEKEG